MNVKIADRIKVAVTVVTGLIMLYALFVSRDHITHVAHLIKLGGYQAETLFVLIDLPALVGKVLQLPYFSASTRRMGRKLMIASGALSLVCNVVSGWFGGGVGPAGYGAFVVVMFVAMESVVMRIKPAAAVTRAKSAAPVKTARKSTARKCAPGCACGKHRAVQPVSPGVGPVGQYAGRKA